MNDVHDSFTQMYTKITDFTPIQIDDILTYYERVTGIDPKNSLQVKLPAIEVYKTALFSNCLLREFLLNYLIVYRSFSDGIHFEDFLNFCWIFSKNSDDNVKTVFLFNLLDLDQDKEISKDELKIFLTFIADCDCILDDNEKNETTFENTIKLSTTNINLAVEEILAECSFNQRHSISFFEFETFIRETSFLKKIFRLNV
ncbi:hypothetical protein SNEBB_004479 [Seison nebaliae]|nr:hypothetical protein SNEBB_004479 [Seison nebaliae]